MLKRVRLVISGRVQGVFFRVSTAREVEKYQSISGWVRNQQNGTVEAVFQGPEAIVNDLINWCQVGPAGAVVDDVYIESLNEKVNETGFQIR